MVKRKRLSLRSKFFLSVIALIVSLFVIFFVSASLFIISLPSQEEIKSCMTTKMFQVNLCPKNPKTYVPLKQIADGLKKAVVTTEDANFYNHNGFDFLEIQNSLSQNLNTKKFSRGGSTISQQLAKNLFLNSEKTLTRKLKEALYTVQIEKSLSKNEILERYLNVIEFGKNIYGVKAASEHYFNKRPIDLSLVESAFLAFLLPSPQKHSVSFYKKELTPFARKRINQILHNLYKQNKIKESEYILAKDELFLFLNPKAEKIKETEEDIDDDSDQIEEEFEEIETSNPNQDLAEQEKVEPAADETKNNTNKTELFYEIPREQKADQIQSNEENSDN